MIYLRSALFKIGQIISLVPFCLVSLLVIPLPAVKRTKVISSWAYFISWWLKVTCKLSYKVTGIENIPNHPIVFASNHQSDWDSIGPQTFLPPIAWVLKQELFKIPLFGWGLWASRPIAINRNERVNALNQIITQGKEKLDEGRYVLIFPEGTRMPYGTPGVYKRGVAKLAKSANVNIVPIAHNAGKFWPKDSWLIKPGVIECRVGKEIQIKDKDDRSILSEIKGWVESQSL